MSWEGFQRYARESQAFLTRPSGRSQDPTIPFFWCAIAAHALFWSLLPAFLQPNVSEETLELLALGRSFAWGYPTQPPLGVWVASLTTSLTAPSIWPLYVLSQICAAVSVWCAWTLGRSFLQPWTALCAALVLLTGFSFSISSGSFTGAHLATMFWSLAILAFHEAFVNPRRRYWVLTGAALGLGFLCSYGTLILLGAMGSFMLFDRRARRCWDSSWWMLALVTVGIVSCFHLWWLMANDFATLAGGFRVGRVATSDSVLRRFAYLGAQGIGFFAICLLLHPVARRVNIVEPVNSDKSDNEFTRIYLTWLTALPAAVILLLSLFADPASSAVSGVSLWIYLGVLLLMWSRLDERKLSWRYVILRTGTAGGLLAAVFIAQQVMLPRLTKQASSTLFPGQELADAVQSAWQRTGAQSSIPVLAGTPQLVRNAAWYAAGSDTTRLSEASVSAQAEAEAGSARWEQNLVKEGGVLMWPAEVDDLPTIMQIRNRFQKELVAVRVLEPVEFKWQTQANVAPVRVRLATVVPVPANYASFQIESPRDVIAPSPYGSASQPYQPPVAPAQNGGLNNAGLPNSNPRSQQAQNPQNDLSPQIRDTIPNRNNAVPRIQNTIPNNNPLQNNPAMDRNNAAPQINRGGNSPGPAFNQGSAGGIYNGGNARSGAGLDPLAQPANGRGAANAAADPFWPETPARVDANRPAGNPAANDPFIREGNAPSTIPGMQNNRPGGPPVLGPNPNAFPPGNLNPPSNPANSPSPRLDSGLGNPAPGGTIPRLPGNLLPGDAQFPPIAPAGNAGNLNARSNGIADPFLPNSFGGTIPAGNPPVNGPNSAPVNPLGNDPFLPSGGAFGAPPPANSPPSTIPRL